MTRSEKEQFVSSFGDIVKDSEAFALMSFEKITVEAMTEFRLSLRKKNVRVKVLKNTLAKRIFEETPYKEVVTHLNGPVLIAYAKEDAVSTAKVLWEWAAKEDFSVKIKTAVALGKVIGPKEIESLSKLPSKEQLLVSFLWCLKYHPTRFLNALQDTPRKLGYALQALKTKKEQENK